MGSNCLDRCGWACFFNVDRVDGAVGLAALFRLVVTEPPVFSGIEYEAEIVVTHPFGGAFGDRQIVRRHDGASERNNGNQQDRDNH